MLVALSLGVVIVVGEWYRGVTTLQQPPHRPELAGGSDGMKATIWTDRGGVASAAAVRLWILLDNQTGKDVKNLQFLTFDTPGFDQIPGCWKDYKDPICSPGGRKSRLPQNLRNRRTAVRYAWLRPRRTFGRHGASGILTWQDPEGRDFYRAVILPGLEFRSDLLDWLSAFVKAAEICLLPVMLAYLGWRLKQRDDKRAQEEEQRRVDEARAEQRRRDDEARAEKERRETAAQAARERRDEERRERERREEKTKADREWQIHMRETWRLQLPKALRSISTFYMPVASALFKLLQLSKSLKAESPEDDLYHWLFTLLRSIRHMTNQPGGLTFKNRLGESLATKCWAIFYRTIRARLKTTDEEGTRIEDAIHARMSLAQFMDLVHGSPESGLPAPRRRRVTEALASMAGSLRDDWLTREDFQQDLVPLEVLLQILLFEMNRPLEPWYGHLPEFPSEDFTEAVSRLRTDDKKLLEDLAKYQRECTAETEESFSRWEQNSRPSV